MPDALCSKLNLKTWQCVLLGYVQNTTKLWRLWDVRRQRVVNGASVRFDEAGFGGRTLEETPMLLEEALGEAYDAGEASGSTPAGPAGPPGGETPPVSTHLAPDAANEVDNTSSCRLTGADDVSMLPGDVSEELETNELASLAPGRGVSAVLRDAGG